MRTTGMTRRIDELGRVVIPKEIRRTMQLREGEEMEIFVEEGRLVLRKFSPVLHLKAFSDEIATSLAEAVGCTVLAVDADNVVSAAGPRAKDYDGKPIMKQIARLLFDRMTRTMMGGDTLAVTGDDINVFGLQIVAPVIHGGDVIGGIVLLSDNAEDLTVKIKLSELSAGIMGSFLQ